MIYLNFSWEFFWLFIVAPLVGAAIAALVYGIIRIPDVTLTTRQAERSVGSQQVQRGRRRA